MHSNSLFDWDDDIIVHATLISINILLLVTLILRFEWPSIVKLFTSSHMNVHNNQKQNAMDKSMHPRQHSLPHKATSSNHVYSASVETVSNTQTSQVSSRKATGNDNHILPVTQDHDAMSETKATTKKSKLPLSALPSGSKIQTVQLTNITSGRNEDHIVEEKDIFSISDNAEEEDEEDMEMFNKVMADDVLENMSKQLMNSYKNECLSTTRRRESIEFYKALFNVDNFDSNGKLLTAKKRHRLNTLSRNDSINLMEHQKFGMYQEDIEEENNNNHTSPMNFITKHDFAKFGGITNRNLNIAQILNSKIYDDESKQSVRSRYRYILYIPLIIFCIFGAISLIVTTLNDEIELYIWVMRAYPALELILSIVLWCQIDILILSCGGAHIVEECLEVQISANGHDYKCIYCCCCDCAVLRFCNFCTYDNGFSLFKCHHKLLKIIICVINPLLTMLFYVISEIHSIRQPLMETSIGQLNGKELAQPAPYWIEVIDASEVYWLLFIIISALYIVFMFTAIYIGILITKSLNFMSSLHPKTLKMQYFTSTIVTFIMQIQFVILLLFYNLMDKPAGNGLGAAIPFFMILVYCEFMIVSIFNHFSFSNKDFVRFGRENIKKNEVQLFDFLPDYDSIHDLHNYRRIYGKSFLYNVDHSAPYEYSIHDEQSVSAQEEEEKSIELKIEKNDKKTMIKHSDVMEEEEEIIIKETNHAGIDSLSLSMDGNDIHLRTTTATTNTTNKETGHHHPETTTSLSLDLDAHYDTNNTSNSSFSSSDDQDFEHQRRKSKKSKIKHQKRRNLSRVDSEVP